MNKSSLQKASIVLAGPIANFILGVFLFIIIFTSFGKNFTTQLLVILFLIVQLIKQGC